MSDAGESPHDASDAYRDSSSPDPDESRHDRTQSYPTPGSGNSLRSWTGARSPLLVVRNYLVVWLVRVAPSLRLKNWLLGQLGASIGPGVSWGLEATPDVFWPNLITVGEDAIIGYDATILCHEFLQEEYRLGAVTIGERAMIGAGAVILPGVEIGADGRVAANSLVAADVPPGTTVAGVPATEQ